MSDRDAFRANRDAGLKARHEQRLENATYTAAEVKVLTARARQDAFDDLLDDWEYGDCPGSKLKIGNQEVWLYTRENVRLWLRDKQRETASKEPSA